MLDPLAELRELVRDSKSGEYVCVSAEDEAHIFLQRGRIAWGADTLHPYAFSRFLKEQGGVPEARLSEIIEQCAKRHSPIGERLIQCGLATEDLVCRALRHQIDRAMETLVALSNPRAVFLTRRFREYRRDLTFELDSFFPPRPRRVADLDAVGTPANLLSRLSRLMPELSWAQILKGKKVVERAFAGEADGKVPDGLVDVMEGQQLDVTIIRSSSGAMVGVGIPGSAGTSLWCEVGGGAALGGAVARIWTLLGLNLLIPPPQDKPSPPLTVGEDSLAVDVALEWLLKEPALLGIFAGDSPASLCGATRDDAITSMAKRRWELLSLAPGASPRVGTLARGMWCLGTHLRDSPEALWVVAEGRMPQGLLWAQLPSLERSLARHALPPGTPAA